MSNVIAIDDACSCTGPVGDCPCLRRQKGLPVVVQEVMISPALWELLTEDEQRTINEIKYRAMGRYLARK